MKKQNGEEMKHSPEMHRLTLAFTRAVNDAHSDGMTPEDITSALAATTAATARGLGANNEEIAWLFESYAFSFSRTKAEPQGKTPEKAETVETVESHEQITA